MSSTTKIYEEKMNNCVAHLDRSPTCVRRAGVTSAEQAICPNAD